MSFQYIIGSYCACLSASYANTSLIAIWRVVPLCAVTISSLCQLSLIHEHLRDRSGSGLFFFPGVSNSSSQQLSLPCTCLGGAAVLSLSKSNASAPSAVKRGFKAGVPIQHSAAICSWWLPTNNSYLAGICLTVEGLPPHMLATSGPRKLDWWTYFHSSCLHQAQWFLNWVHTCVACTPRDVIYTTRQEVKFMIPRTGDQMALCFWFFQVKPSG